MTLLNTPSGAGRPEIPVIDPPGVHGSKTQLIAPLCAGTVGANISAVTPPDAGSAEAPVIIPLDTIQAETEALVVDYLLVASAVDDSGSLT